jgi:hypothetical protein
MTRKPQDDLLRTAAPAARTGMSIRVGLIDPAAELHPLVALVERAKTATHSGKSRETRRARREQRTPVEITRRLWS